MNANGTNTGLAQVNGERVEESTIAVDDANAQLGQLMLEQASECVHLGSDLAETVRAVVDSVHGRHVGEQSLSCANVGGGLFTTNVLLTRLEGETVGGLSTSILAETNETTRDLALDRVADGKEGGVGTTESGGYTESGSVTESNIGAPLSRRLDHGEGQEVSSSDDHTAVTLDLLGKRLPVGQATINVGVLNEGTNDVVAGDLVGRWQTVAFRCSQIGDSDLDAETLGTLTENGNGLGRTPRSTRKVFLLLLVWP